VDLLVELSSGERVGIEIKTARADLSIPHEHHVDQVKTYNTMFDCGSTLSLPALHDCPVRHPLIEHGFT